jgi:hypothetical protein
MMKIVIQWLRYVGDWDEVIFIWWWGEKDDYAFQFQLNDYDEEWYDDENTFIWNFT